MYRKYKLLVAAAALALVGTFLNAAPPGPEKGEAKPRAAAAPQTVKMRKIPFLGIASTERVASAQPDVDLPDGVGLIVQHVSPGTPAAKAGVQRLDVLYKLNDQILINNPQFRVLLRTFRPGEPVELTLIRQGKPVKVEVLLGEAEVPMTDAPCGQPLWPLAPGQPTAASSGFSATYEDRQHLLTLRVDSQGKYLVVQDKRGETVFEGPITTDKDRKALPESLRSKLEVLETLPQSKPQPAASVKPKPGAL